MLCIGGAIVLDYWKTVIGLTDLIIWRCGWPRSPPSLIFQSPVRRAHYFHP